MFSAAVSGQDTLVLTNGKHLTGVELLRIQDDYLYYQTRKNDKEKIKQLSQDQVFAIYTSEGMQIVTYIYDTTGIPLDQTRMRDLLDGMEHAWGSYHNTLVPVIGFVVSGAAGATFGVPLGLIVPVVYPLVIAVRTPKEKNLRNIPKDKNGNYEFVSGYKNVAKGKKVRSSVLSGGTGFLAGLLVFIYFVSPG